VLTFGEALNSSVEEFMHLLTRPAAVLGLLALSVVPAQAAVTPPPASGPGGKVVITSCLVMFALKSSGSSATNAGMFNTDRRSEVTVTKVFELAGFDTTAFQRVTDQMCGGAPAALTAAGYEVVAPNTDHYSWQDALERGKDSPKEEKANGTEYRVYAPTGARIIDPLVVGGMAASRLTWSETTMGNHLSAKPVNIIYTVDFASLQDQNRRSQVANQNTARLTASVNLTVGATVVSYDASEDNVRCTVLGASRAAREQPYCMLKKNQRVEGTYSTDSTTSRRFADAIVSVEEKGQGVGGVALGAANALALVAGSRRRSLEIFTVTVDPSKYEEAAQSGAAEVLTNAMRWIHEPETRPRRGRR
jgi:hypothetical protein